MDWETVVAFITGVGSVLGAYTAIKRIVRYCDKQCALRMEAFKEGLREKR